MIVLDEIIKSGCTEPFDTTKRILERMTRHKLGITPTETEDDPWKLAHPSKE